MDSCKIMLKNKNKHSSFEQCCINLAPTDGSHISFDYVDPLLHQWTKFFCFYYKDYILLVLGVGSILVGLWLPNNSHGKQNSHS
jgi:hypothetical protein